MDRQNGSWAERQEVKLDLHIKELAFEEAANWVNENLDSDAEIVQANTSAA